MKAGRVEQAAEQKSACTSTGAAPVGKRGLGVAAWERALPAKPPTAAKLPLQAKLTVNEPGDAYEQEADRVAEQVMRMPEQRVQRAQCACGGKAGPDGECEACKAKRLGLQMKVHPAGGGAAMREAPESVHQVISSPGQQLDAATRAFMEPRFGQNFDGVRVHTGPEAAASAAAVGAKAFTVGKNITFGTGEYAPYSPAGRRLLAHELTHVIQQNDLAQPRVQRQAFDCGDLLANPSILSLVGGSAVHAAIAEHFAGSVAGATNVMIPGASASPLRSGGLCGEDTTVIPPQLLGGAAGAGFPDLARITTGRILQVAEIKPAAIPCLIDGEEQLLRYINQGNATDPAQVAWRAALGVTVVAPMLTSAYQPPSFSIGVAQVKTAWCSPGLLAYTVLAPGGRVPVTVPSGERSQERQRYRESAGDRIPATVAVGVGAVATAVVGRALWRHFWRAVAQRFALRGAVALSLAAIDGPLPFGEIVDIGIGVATAIEIFVVWGDLWREADRIAAAEGA